MITAKLEPSTGSQTSEPSGPLRNNITKPLSPDEVVSLRMGLLINPETDPIQLYDMAAEIVMEFDRGSFKALSFLVNMLGNSIRQADKETTDNTLDVIELIQEISEDRPRSTFTNNIAYPTIHESEQAVMTSSDIRTMLQVHGINSRVGKAAFYLATKLFSKDAEFTILNVLKDCIETADPIFLDLVQGGDLTHHPSNELRLFSIVFIGKAIRAAMISKDNSVKKLIPKATRLLLEILFTDGIDHTERRAAAIDALSIIKPLFEYPNDFLPPFRRSTLQTYWGILRRTIEIRDRLNNIASTNGEWRDRSRQEVEAAKAFFEASPYITTNTISAL